MPDFRRNLVAGGTYFFTLVTNHRRPILTTPLGRVCLRTATKEIQAARPFELFAFVLLPDHLHTIWILPPGDADYSTRWAQIKEGFTRRFLCGGGEEIGVSKSRTTHRERGVWQRRFWEHTCRDEEDLKRFADYLHWNPRKHGLVRRISDYPWSSFHRFVRLGEYDEGWGGTDPYPNWNDPEWE